MNIYYAGIGSRETPKEVLDMSIRFGAFFAKKGLVLRSGGAEGADIAFEKGCDMLKGKKEIYLPWKDFNHSISKLIVSNKRAFEIAEKYHPYWANLAQGAQKLQARNSHQVLGMDLNTPSSFILCWTKDGKSIGGTGQALRVANDYKIPVFNMGKYESISDIKTNLKEFLIVNNILTEEDFEPVISL